METEKDRAALQQAITALSDVPEPLIGQLFSICKKVTLKKGSQFLRADEVPRSMGLNLSGVFRLYYIDQDGNDMTKGFCTPGRYVVSYSALAQKRPSHFAIEALTDCEILQFDYHQWHRMIDNDFRWYPYVFKLVEAMYIMKESREKSFLLDSATERYLAFKQEYPDLENKIKLYHVASFIGITPEALSRLRKTLKIELDQGK